MPLYPISYSIPESTLVDDVPVKTRMYSVAHPIRYYRTPQTHDNEGAYYQNYREAAFGKTFKKGGWDCMRHYEILVNGCIPYFEDLAQCPKNTLTMIPRDLIFEGMKLAEIPFEEMDWEKYNDVVRRLLKYTREHLTTKCMAQYVMNKCNIQAKKVLILHFNNEYYMSHSMINGFKHCLGTNAVEYPHAEVLYEDYPEDRIKHFYGLGFSYTRRVPSAYKTNYNVYDIINQIQNKEYDLIYYGINCDMNPSNVDFYKCLPLWNEVNQKYSPQQIAICCGQDGDPYERVPESIGQGCYHRDFHACSLKALSDRGYNVFIRELGD
jgi:hypothetical protein